jgi:RNA polymerase sigma factor (sigma-70 family)
LPDKERITSLVCAAQAGDDLSFAELVRNYQDIVVAYATSILGDYYLAEDAAQEAFVEAYRGLPSLREPAAFAGWLRTIVFKHCDRLTRRKRPPITGLEAALEVVSLEPSPQESLELQERAKSVRKAIAALSEADRQVVLLYYMGENSTAAIAEFLNVTTNTVKTKLYSARKRLKKYMGQIEDNLQAARPSNDPRFARRVITAALPLQLYYIDNNGSKQAAGSTVASRAAEVPNSNTWLVEPRRPMSEKDWDMVIGLMGEMQIPGLSAAGQMTDELLERVSHLDHITYLGLQWSNQLTDTGLQHLARLPLLQHLNLSGCRQITDRGLEILSHLPSLKTFHLSWHDGISDTGGANLTFCDHLECVDLMGTPTGDDTLSALTGKDKLRLLKTGNSVTNSGLALLPQFPVFKTWQGGETAISLMGFVATPNHLLLRGSFTDQGLASLAGLDGLFGLNLDDRNLKVTAAGLKHLMDLPNLGWLGFDATDEGMHYISAMPRLRMLMCQDTVAGDEGFMALSHSQTIEYIWGRRCYNLTGRGFAALAAMPALCGLSVSCKNVDDAGLSALPHFPALRQFMSMDVPDDGFNHVGRCKQLESLILMYCPETTDVATGHIAGLTGLKTYEAWSTRITDKSLEILGGMLSLERIVLSDLANVTPAGLVSVAGLPRLREITLDILPQVAPENSVLFPAHVRVNIITE